MSDGTLARKIAVGERTVHQGCKLRFRIEIDAAGTSRKDRNPQQSKVIWRHQLFIGEDLLALRLCILARDVEMRNIRLPAHRSRGQPK